MFRFPLPKILIAVIIGILIARGIIFDFTYVIIVACAVLAFMLIFSFLLKRYYYKFNLLNVVIILYGVLTGMILQISNNYIFYNYELREFPENTILKVISTPQLKGKNYRFKCKIIDEESSPDIFVYVRNQNITDLPKRADIIQTKKSIRVIENGPQSTFDFKRYCHRNNIAYATYLNNNEINFIDTTNKSFILFFENLQKNLADKLLYYLEDTTHFSIAAALILGYDELTQETRTVFSSTGAIHVLCVSGLHVSTIFLLITALFKPLSNIYFKRYISPILTLIILWVYAAITGFSPSVTRASFMLSFILVGTLLNRDVFTINTLSGAAVIMIINNPNIIYNIGFQLSFCAVLGIISFNNTVHSKLSNINKITNKIKFFPRKIFSKLIDLTSISLSVQLLLAPILLHYFKVFPTYFLLANFIAIPIASIILYLGIILLIVSPIKFLAPIVAKLLNTGIGILLSGVNVIHNIPFSTLEISYFNTVQVILFLIFIFLFVGSLKLGFSKQKVIASLFLIIVFLTIGFF